MIFKERQSAFDDVKWYDSIQEGADRCGSYDFCVCCRKDEPYPCARAMHRRANGYVRVARIHRLGKGVQA